MRRRSMFNATGVPGWMRFGFGPGRGGGPGPCAQYLLTGQWPTPQLAAAWQAMQMGAGPVPAPSTQVQALKTQAEMMETQLAQLRETITHLEGG